MTSGRQRLYNLANKNYQARNRNIKKKYCQNRQNKDEQGVWRRERGLSISAGGVSVGPFRPPHLDIRSPKILSLTSNGCVTSKMLYLVGLGLADETDITVKGLDIVKKAERVYLEAYTSILLVKKDKLVSANSSSDPSILC